MNIVMFLLFIAASCFGVYNYSERKKIEKEKQNLAKRFVDILQQNLLYEEQERLQAIKQEETQETKSVDISSIVGQCVIIDGIECFVDGYSFEDEIWYLHILFDRENGYDIIVSFGQLTDLLEGKEIHTEINGKHTMVLKKS